MKFVCERCHTKYSIADEKVRGKVLKVRCKTCANVITVREAGATIDDADASGPREAPISLSGSFDAARAAAAIGTGGKLAGLPAAALVAPGSPAAAPPPRRATPAPPAVVDDVEWYLAVDGAQTGPFPRSRLVDKILATPKDADVHVWHADLDSWKPPKNVAEIQAELTRRRRSPTSAPPPPLRRPSAPVMPLAAGSHGHAVSLEAGGEQGGLLSLDAGSQSAKLPAPAKKKNGIAAAAGAAQGRLAEIGIADLIGDFDAGATPPPVGVFKGASARTTGAALDSVAAATPALVAPADWTGGTVTGKGKQVKLLVGVFAVVLVLCGIVSVWMFRRPAAVAGSAAAKSPAADSPAAPAKVAHEEARPTPEPGVAPPAPVVETKPLVTRPEPPQKGGKGKRRKNQTTPPPLAGGSPGGLTAEQREAAQRFGETTGRDVRFPTSNSNSAHATPAQADISRVINNNRQGIQTCYQRALLRDNTLTHGKVTVRVSIGLSGKVKSVNLDAPLQFRALEPCIRDVMSRWAFPPSSEEYGTEFPVVLQGNQ